MLAYRLTRAPFADLSGLGGFYREGRWHSRGKRVTYLGSSIALCVLEWIVNADIPPELLPSDYVVMTVNLPDDMAAEAVEPGDLPEDWRSFPGRAHCRPFGDRWLDARRAPLLAVPSAVVPTEVNRLLNPQHPDAARAEIVSVDPFDFDPRLFG